MKQINPSLTPTAVRTALIASASSTPLNGGSPGVWNVNGGFGFVDATKALAAASSLNVLSVTPDQRRGRRRSRPAP